jgi:IS110 family transposase
MTLGIAGALDVTLKYLRRNCVQAELAENHSVSQPTISRATTAVTDTHAYAAKRTAEGKSKKDILRCLKRAIAREVFHLITHPQPVQSAADLRPARRQLGLTITDVANALGCGIAKISRIERGHIRDTRFLHDYRDWLISQQSLRTAA